MKKLIIFLFLIIFLNSTTILVAQIDSKIVIKVENKIITNFDVKNKILSSLIVSNQDINQENINKYKKVILNLMIDLQLKKIEVNKYNIKVDNNKITTYLKTISPNIQILKKKFIENDLDFEIYVNEISTELKWQELILQLYSKKINIDDKNINSEIDELVKKESFIEEYKISKLEIPSNNNDQKDKTIILEIQKEIDEDGFDEVSLKYNEGLSATDQNDLGWINSKSLSDDIYKLLANMKKGEISSPIKKQNSIILLKLKDKRISKTDNLNIDELKKKIINQKRNEQFDLYSKSYVSKLRNTSVIEYK
ncbi:peptidylprolyl isomerase [Pelagibacteraceae bacterium]|nr:peptidylprolyl isomerase [Pelagibacteraceae bacterium]